METFEPNTTPNPNWVYDEEMSEMNETELKVVLLVTRKTLGWVDPTTKERKKQDYISQSQFIKFTGQSHTAIAKAIQVAVEIGWIVARDREGNLCNTPERRRRRKVWYQLGSDKAFIKKKSKQQSCLDKNLSNNLAKSKQQSCTHLSNNVDNTKETITKETKQTLSANADGVLNSTVNEIINSMNSSSGQLGKKLEIFNYDKYLDNMKNDKRRHIQIIRLFFLGRNRKYINLEQTEAAMNRNFKAAKTLVGYSDKQIEETMLWLDTKFNSGETRWTLETVGKYIDDLRNQSKSRIITR